jgi:mono/diheme cytochrome c family protein
MDSNVLIRIHSISVMLFVLTYLIKTILLFSNKGMLVKYTRVTKVPEMIISFAFLVTGVWLFAILGGIKFFQILKLAFVIISIPVAVIGFKKMKKGMALLALLLIIGAYGLSEMSKNKPFIPAKVVVAPGIPSTTTVLGEKIYLENCTFCHGAGGNKMYRNATDLTNSVLSADLIRQMVKEGSKGKMPAYRTTLSDENINAVAAFVINLRHKEFITQ